MRGWSHLLCRGRRTICETAFSDCLLERILSRPTIPPCKWMAPHEEEQEADDRKAEVILVWCADNSLKGLALEFGRCKILDPDFTQEVPPIGVDLDGITINQLNGPLPRQD